MKRYYTQDHYKQLTTIITTWGAAEAYHIPLATVGYNEAVQMTTMAGYSIDEATNGYAQVKRYVAERTDPHAVGIDLTERQLIHMSLLHGEMSHLLCDLRPLSYRAARLAELMTLMAHAWDLARTDAKHLHNAWQTGQALQHRARLFFESALPDGKLLPNGVA